MLNVPGTVTFDNTCIYSMHTMKYSRINQILTDTQRKLLLKSNVNCSQFLHSNLTFKYAILISRSKRWTTLDLFTFDIFESLNIAGIILPSTLNITGFILPSTHVAQS